MRLSSLTLSESLSLPTAPPMFDGVDFPSVDLLVPMTVCFLPPKPDGPPPPPDVLYTPEGESLYPFQEEGVDFLLSHPTTLLADEMGLGKSIQAVAALRLLIGRGEVQRALILCPKTLIYDWYQKLWIWAPDLKVIPIEGKQSRRRWYWRAPCHINIVGYEAWRDDLRDGHADPSAYDLVILDEAQRIKNAKTTLHQAVSQLEAAWRWGLTGTPVENQIKELGAIFAYLKPGLLPTVKGSTKVIQDRVAEYVLRRRKADVLDLPPKEHETVFLDLTPVQRMAYEAAERAAWASFREVGPVAFLALLTKLKQICNFDVATGSSCKMDYLDQVLGPIVDEGEKVLIFSQYPEKSLAELLPRLAKYSVALFDGSLRDWDRQMLVTMFQKTERPKVMAMSLKAGGVGITLTRASRVYHLDHWWNPAVAAQAEDRTHRIGQTRSVKVVTLLTRNTVEERIAQVLADKRALFHEIMDPLTNLEAGNPQEWRRLQRSLTKEDYRRILGIQEEEESPVAQVEGNPIATGPTDAEAALFDTEITVEGGAPITTGIALS
jgi:SNF2 family DNA or RNA helicase